MPARVTPGAVVLGVIEANPITAGAKPRRRPRQCSWQLPVSVLTVTRVGTAVEAEVVAAEEAEVRWFRVEGGGWREVEWAGGGGG